MNWLDSLVAGIVQGLTEFLPVSSSGHLVVVQYFYGVPNLNSNFIYTTLLHGGTLLAVTVALWKDLCRIVRTAIAGEAEGRLLALSLLVATIPGALAGVLFGDKIDKLFITEGWTLRGFPIEPFKFVGLAFIVTAHEFLHKADLASAKLAESGGTGMAAEGMSLRHALRFGLAQALAVIPGISRSGATISTGIMAGFSREYAARFSFLMSIPIILGALVHTLFLSSHSSGFWTDLSYKPAGELRAMAIGVAAAAVTGFAAVKFMLRIIQTWTFHRFIVYLWILGLVCIAS